MHSFLRSIAISALALCISQPSLAQTSTELVKANEAKQYELIKRVMKSIMDRDDHSLYFADENHINLYNCGNAEVVAQDIGKGNQLSINLTDLSYEILAYEITLSKYGYPRNLWEPFIRRYEATQLTAISRGTWGNESDAHKDNRLKQWAEVLNNYRSSHSNKLPKVVVEGGCGAGGILASFKSQPANARILFIPKLYYNLCRAQGLNPDDENTCDRWKEVFPGQKA